VADVNGSGGAARRLVSWLVAMVRSALRAGEAFVIDHIYVREPPTPILAANRSQGWMCDFAELKVYEIERTSSCVDEVEFMSRVGSLVQFCLDRGNDPGAPGH
jgi:hypothetical protein